MLIEQVKDLRIVFLPILENFCPLLVQIAQMGLILPRWDPFGSEYHPQLLFFTHLSHVS